MEPTGGCTIFAQTKNLLNMATLTTTDAVIVELYDNPLTERPDDRYGRVINIASVDVDTLIERAINNGFNGNADSMNASYLAIKHEAIKAATRGEIVTFGLGHTAIDVEGSFIGDAPQWNPEVNKLVAGITPIKELRDALKQTPVKVIGMAPNQSAIVSVTDVASGKVNELLTPGGMANIKGTRIKIVGDKPAIGLFLTNHDSQETMQVPATAIGLNDPSKVMFVVPADLAAGTYQLSIVTQFCANSTRFLNEPRTVICNQLLTVG
jgi:hypothetical protein